MLLDRNKLLSNEQLCHYLVHNTVNVSKKLLQVRAVSPFNINHGKIERTGFLQMIVYLL